MKLNSPEQVRDYIGETLLEALQQPAVRAALGDRPARLRLGLVDPDCVLLLDAEAGRIALGPGSDADVTGFVAMSGDTAVLYCSGVLTLAEAITSGVLFADGACAEVMEALAFGATVAHLYADRVVNCGRADLLDGALLAG